MTDEPGFLTRRTALKTVGAGGVLALAGCIGDDADDEVEPTDDDTDDTDDDETDVDPDDDQEDEEEDDDEEDEVEPNEDIQQLVEIFDDQPFNDAQFEVSGENRDYTPSHVWKFVSDESFIALHLNEPNPEEASELLYIVVGRKGVFSEESKPGEEFTHFHMVEADGWEAGHGGEDADSEGYWLTHIAATELELPFHDGPTGPGVDYEFMPTDPEAGSGGHHTDFTSPVGDEGSLSAEDRDALLDVFDDEPFNDDQLEAEGADRNYTPSHVWWEANDDVTVFLHFDAPNPEEADDLLYFGLGVDGQFTSADIPLEQAEDFTHFHLYEADSWEAGHGGDDVDDEGMWLIHHAAIPGLEMPFHEEPIDVGVDREFMPTPAPDA